MSPKSRLITNNANRTQHLAAAITVMVATVCDATALGLCGRQARRRGPTAGAGQQYSHVEEGQLVETRVLEETKKTKKH